MLPPKRVLVVDDEKELAQVIGDYLTLKGFKTTLAFDGREAFQKSHNAKFDVIITDYRMPKVSGAELVNYLRNGTFNADTPVIIISGYMEEAVDEIETLEIRGLKILPKPIDVEYLAKLIGELGVKQITDPGSKIDVKFLNPFITGAIEILSTMADLKDIKNSAPTLLSKAQNPRADISGIVGIVSTQFQGSISLSFQSDTYLKIINSMLGENHASIDDKNQDGIGEILNIILGKAKTSLAEIGLQITRSLPSVKSAPQHALPGDNHPKTILISFDSSSGPFWITIILNQFPGL